MNVAGAPYWDLFTNILYIIMGLVPVWAIYQTDKRKSPYQKWWKNPYLIVWIIIWTIFGGGRWIAPGRGGMDAYNYMDYFVNCLNPQYLKSGVMEQYNSNIGYRWLNRILRTISSNGYFFIIVESLILATSSIYFVSKFRMKAESCIPYFLMVFWYIRGFSSIRSHLATATFMIALCMAFMGKKKWSIGLSLYSALLHPMLAIYFPFIVLYLWKRNFKLNIKRVTILFFLLFALLAPIKQLLLQNISIFGDFSEHYESYVTGVAGDSFFDNAWKIAFEQLILLLFMLISQRELKRYSTTLNGTYLEAYNLIYKLCMYDFLLVPVCYALNIWRGYEVCYIPRLIMWAILVYIGARKFPITIRLAYNLAIFTLFLAWFLQRTSAESFWLETGLMPYIFAPSLLF